MCTCDNIRTYYFSTDSGLPTSFNNDHMTKLTKFIKLCKLVHDYVCTRMYVHNILLFITRQMLVALRDEPEVQKLNNCCM